MAHCICEENTNVKEHYKNHLVNRGHILLGLCTIVTSVNKHEKKEKKGKGREGGEERKNKRRWKTEGKGKKESNVIEIN
jgi:hypothetical protein